MGTEVNKSKEVNEKKSIIPIGELFTFLQNDFLYKWIKGFSRKHSSEITVLLFLRNTGDFDKMKIHRSK